MQIVFVWRTYDMYTVRMAACIVWGLRYYIASGGRNVHGTGIEDRQVAHRLHTVCVVQ